MEYKRSAEFEPVGTRVWSGGFFGHRIAGIRPLLVRVHRGQKRLPFTQRQKDFLIVEPRVIRGIDHEKTELAGVGAAMQIQHGLGMRVVPSRTRRLGHELITPAAMRRHRGCTFFLRPVHLRGNQQTVPMHVLRNVRAVHNLYGDALALSHPQQGTGDLVAVADSAEHNLGRQLNRHRCDPQGEIRRAPGGLRFRRRHLRMLWRPRNLRRRLRERGPQLTCSRRDRGGPSKPCKIPPVHVILTPVANARAKRPPPTSAAATKIARGILPFFPFSFWLNGWEKTNILSVLRNGRKDFLGQSRSALRGISPVCEATSWLTGKP